MTPAQRAAARTAHTEAVHVLRITRLGGGWTDLDEPAVLVDVIDQLADHTERLAGHLALALADGPADTYARLNR